MKITFDTTDYTNTHGKAPKGHGMWAFDLTYHNGRGGYDSGSMTFTGSLTEAKAAAKQTAKGSCFGARECTISVRP